MKPQPRIVQPWAWVFLLLAPYVLFVPMCWYMASDSSKVSAILQMLSKAVKDGALKQPEFQSLALTTLGSSTPFNVLVACIGVVILMMLAIIFSARRHADAQQLST